jgi:3-hydroxyacyl-CoA dehydrogenase/3-hydroxy-2-methylbutyryl-CoA dehydrogenase
LGAACVRLLLKEGAARVAILDYNEETGNKMASEWGDQVLFLKTDVSQDDDVKSVVNTVAEKWGDMHIVINCAGIGSGNGNKVISRKKMTYDAFAWVININLIGTMNIIRHTADKMINNQATNEDGEKGVVINTASIAAFEGQVGEAAYSASKSGIVGMTLPLAREFAVYGIRVMTIAPGTFKTPMMAGLPEAAQKALVASTPFPKRPGKPEEFAALAKNIIENSMFNGETIRLDGAVRLA